MKSEPLLLTILGAVFLVELAIGVPALWSEYTVDREESSSMRLVAVATPSEPAPAATAPSAAMSVAPSPQAPSARVATTRATTARAATLRVARTRVAATQVGTTRAAVTPPAAGVRKTQPIVVVDDVPQQNATASFDYAGHWEHVRAIEDGRTAGTSSRSFRPGSNATLSFTGTEVRVFGVCGPSGGRAVVTLDGRRTGPLTTFFAATKETHMLVYTSPRLRFGQHRLSIAVAPVEQSSAKHYINLDGAEYD